MLRNLVKSFVKKPQQMYFVGEDSDEKILYVLRKAFITNIWWVFGGTTLLVAPVLINIFIITVNWEFHDIITPGFVFIINSFWYLFSLGYIFERFLSWYFNVYIITNKRIVDMDYNHLLNRNISEAPLRNVEDITHTVKGFLGTVFNYGTVSIQTAAERRELEFEDVVTPAKIQDILSDLVSEVKAYYG